MITAAMRDLLIEHIDGPTQVNAQGNQMTLWRAAFAKGLIIGIGNSSRPSRSRLTEHGRLVLAKELGNWADALVRAGYDLKTTPKWSKPVQLAA